MFTRCAALTNIALGLVHYFDRDYEEAMQSFELADRIDGWKDDKEKKVLYLLLGNTVLQKNYLKVENSELGSEALLGEAEGYYLKALSIDKKYSRAYIGLGSLSYSRALLPFEESKNIGDIDNALLELSRAYFDMALYTKDQSPIADIEVKAHFGLGGVLDAGLLRKDQVN